VEVTLASKRGARTPPKTEDLFCVDTRSLFGHASTLKVIGLFCVHTRSLLDAMPGANSANAEADAKQSVTKVGVDNQLKIL